MTANDRLPEPGQTVVFRAVRVKVRPAVCKR